ncbi:hypothetical protein N7U66_18175 [Lacinutrix neustonica]|uniref:Lipoprotein n=1 Tax=Lacinutrix neustonica TaxID=2980107 RepID=A0A9E8SGJ5_9FLAO|nr:hypothetical protein [Lacinutrix neustonica]WAC01790.1 hypothetical protein N7U66_18175 [Lacinutrix neustonica]
MKKSINLLVIVMLLFMSCETENVSSEDPLDKKELDSEAVFKSLFFYLGEEAKSIPTFDQQVTLLNDTKKEDNKFFNHYTAAAEDYLNEVKEKNPSFLKQLAHAVQNKDFEQVKEELVYGRGLLMAIIYIDLPESARDTILVEQLTNLDVEHYNFTDIKELEALNKKLITIVSEFNFSDEQNRPDPSPHPDLLRYQLAYNYSLKLIEVTNNFARVLIYPYNPTFPFASPRALPSNYLCLPRVQVKKAPIMHSDYDNYSEKN